MERPLKAIAYAAVVVLGFVVAADFVDDLLWGNRWAAPTALAFGLASLALTTLTAYQRLARDDRAEQERERVKEDG